jgi:hypothetical protein
MSVRMAMLLSAALAACASSGPQDSLPLVQPQLNDQVLRNPRLVTITYANYEFRDEAEAFGDFAVGSSWLQAVVGEYGIGPGTHLPVRMPDPAPPSTDFISEKNTLRTWIDSGLVPAPDDRTVYMIYVSAATADVDSGGTKSCIASKGFHDFDFDATLQQAYAIAVIYDCRGGLDDLTATASHELVEAATDPFLASNYVIYDPNLGVTAESADMCEFLDAVREGGFDVTRAWSNAAARGGRNPCVPAPSGDVYYNVEVSPSVAPVMKAGDSGVYTFVLTGWSEGPVSPWVLIPIPGEGSTIDLGVSLDTNRMNNGGKAKLTLTVPPDAKAGFGYVHIYSGPGWGRDRIVGVKVPSVQFGADLFSVGSESSLLRPLSPKG